MHKHTQNPCGYVQSIAPNDGLSIIAVHMHPTAQITIILCLTLFKSAWFNTDTND